MRATIMTYTGFAKALKAALGRRGWNQSDLARAVRIKASNVSRWLSVDDPTTPSPNTFELVKDALPNDVDELTREWKAFRYPELAEALNAIRDSQQVLAERDARIAGLEGQLTVAQEELRQARGVRLRARARRDAAPDDPSAQAEYSRSTIDEIRAHRQTLLARAQQIARGLADPELRDLVGKTLVRLLTYSIAGSEPPTTDDTGSVPWSEFVHWRDAEGWFLVADRWLDALERVKVPAKKDRVRDLLDEIAAATKGWKGASQEEALEAVRDEAELVRLRREKGKR